MYIYKNVYVCSNNFRRLKYKKVIKTIFVDVTSEKFVMIKYRIVDRSSMGRWTFIKNVMLELDGIGNIL